MTVKVLSSDPNIVKLCRDIVLVIPESTGAGKVSLLRPEDSVRQADIEIWDFQPGLLIGENSDKTIDETIDESAANERAWRLFLVDPDHLSSLHERTGGTDANVLLKPVTRSTLLTCLLAGVFQQAAKTLRADRDEVLQCLIQTHLRLQESDHDRTAFLARAIHDLQGPLTAVGGYCGLLLSEALGSLNETQKEVLRRVQNSAKRLSRMAGAMFDLSAGRQVNRRLDMRAADIRECFDRALHEIAPFANQKSISIAAEIESCAAGLYFESAEIVQVLVNIFDNACRFSPRGGSIEIRGYPFFWERRDRPSGAAYPADRRRAGDRRPNSYRVDIGDSGAAIPDGHIRKIFEEYTSYAGGRDRSGGGLGLAICKMIVSRHHGRIFVENRETGPVFSFLLPLQKNPETTYAPGSAQIRPQANGAATYANQ